MIRVIHLGDSPALIPYDVALLRRLRRARDEHGNPVVDAPTFDVDLPYALRDGVRLAFVVVPEGRKPEPEPPSPFFELCQLLGNSASFPVFYDDTPAWIIVIHK